MKTNLQIRDQEPSTVWRRLESFRQWLRSTDELFPPKPKRELTGSVVAIDEPEIEGRDPRPRLIDVFTRTKI